MLREDIEGLSPKQIRDKYALPVVPEYVCDVVLEAGTTLRVGVANAVEGWGMGGGIQFDMIGQIIGSFINQRRITDVHY